MIEIRRDLHRHPEVSGQEERTAAIVADRLRDLGFAVRTGIGGHGVVGILAGAQPGPVVAFRADMDAVASSAPDPVEFRSLTPGVRHICGHDLHTTIGLALAEGFSSTREDLAGTVMLVFQPSEENARGARAMLADDVFGDPKPDAIYAVHTAPMPVGAVATAMETLLAWRDSVTVRVTGTGDLEAAAQEVHGRIEALATVTQEQAVQPAPPDAISVQSGAPRTTDEGDYAVTATISTANREAQELLEVELAELAFEGVSIHLDYQHKWVAGATNSRPHAERAVAVARSTLGEEAVLVLDNVIPAFSEDFGTFQQHVPGVMFFLGVSNPEKGWVGMPHSPGYVADEEAIFVGARLMGAVMLDFLTSP
ncbi:MAG: M20 family metallopeptidase [Thermoanaerobaculia bacterium]